MIGSMNMNYGGKGGKYMRDSEITADCLGPGKAFLYRLKDKDGNISWSLERPEKADGITIRTINCKLKVGQVQSMMFDTCDKRKKPYPPFNDLTAPLEDTHMKDAKGKKIKTKEGKFKVKEGYAGKAKGVAQVLWERGLWVEGMKMKLDVDDPDYPELSASTVLANCEDFREEVVAMEKLMLP